jgi:hypothetical protein
VLNHAAQGQLSWFDAAYSVFVVPLGLSAVFESRVLKWAQVGIIFATGVLISVLSQETLAIGFVLMAFAQMFAYTYGFFSGNVAIKVGIVSVVYAVLFVISLQNVASAIMWTMMSITIHGGIWINVRHLVERARKADELEKMHLEQDLMKSQALLEEAVSAGVVLVEEIKHKEADDGRKG